MSAFELRLSQLALSDIRSILEVSERVFGRRSRERYGRLIESALDAIRIDPARPAVARRPELGAGVLSYHLAFARKAGARKSGRADRVRRARHLIVFRIEGRTVLVGRVLHDAMDLPRHVPRVWDDIGWG